MIGLVGLLFHFRVALFKSRQRLEAENAALRRQLIILVRRAPKRLHLTDADRLVFFCLYGLFPSIYEALVVGVCRPPIFLNWL